MALGRKAEEEGERTTAIDQNFFYFNFFKAGHDDTMSAILASGKGKNENQVQGQPRLYKTFLKNAKQRS